MQNHCICCRKSISLLAGVVFLGEPFGIVSLLAAVIIVIGVWGVQRQPKA